MEPWPRIRLLLGAAAVVVLAVATEPDEPVIDRQLRDWRSASADVKRRAELEIPGREDWVDRGEIFEEGVDGDWDRYLWGGFAASPVLLGGVVHLYYQGARGYRTGFDETVTWRAIGLATSYDGVRFVKDEDNPVITWFPGNEEEEGATSAAAVSTAEGEVALYYGANTALSPTAVRADARLAWSSEGRVFEDRGVVLDHADGRVWGSGDELFPVAAIVDEGSWIVYYIPNGTLEKGRLGVAWGARPDELGSTSEVLSPGGAVSAWGAASVVGVGDGTYALFVSNVRAGRIQAYLLQTDTPWLLTDPVATYAWDGVQQGVVQYDPESRTFSLYYRAGRSYGLKTAVVH